MEVLKRALAVAKVKRRKVVTPSLHVRSHRRTAQATLQQGLRQR